MALLCIPLSELVSFAFSTIPICPFLIQRFFSFTCLYRSCVFGAMQVKCSSGDYMNVPYRSDAVLVNLGALMQNWTSDVYVATVRQPCM